MRSWSSNATKRPANVSPVRQPRDWLLLFHVACFASAAPMLMRLQLPRLQRLLEPKTRRPPPTPAQVQQITRYVEAVRRRGRPLVRSSCLTRGLTLYYFLRRSGLEVTLEFGMASQRLSSPDNVNDALVIKVQGSSGTTVRWVASVRTVEVGR